MKISNKQFKETCHLIIEINNNLKNFLKVRKKLNKHKPKKKGIEFKMEDLLKIPEINSDTSDDNLPEFIDEINDPNYSSDKDLTSSHTTKEKDLIPPPKNTKNKSKKPILLSLCRALWRIFRAKMENLAG